MAYVIDNLGRLHGLEELPEGGGVFGRVVLGQINDAVANDAIGYDTSGNIIDPNIGVNQVFGRNGSASLVGLSMAVLHAMLQGQVEYHISMLADATEHTFPVANLLTLVTRTSDYTVITSDEVIICDATTGAFTLTLPAVAGTQGKRYYIKKIDSTANIVTIDGNSSETVDDGTTAALENQYEAVTIVSDNTEWFVI